MANQTVVKVAIENTVYHFDRLFDYLVPDSLASCAQVGCRVMVPFGNGNATRLGMIFSRNSNPCLADVKLKSISAVLDQAPLLNEEMLKLSFWLKDRYFCTLFDAVKLLLPTGINYTLTVEYGLVDRQNPLKREDFTDTEWFFISYLTSRKKPVKREQLLSEAGLSADHDILEKLAQRGILLKTSDAVRKIGDATQKMAVWNEDAPQGKLTKKQSEVLRVLQDIGCVSVKELCYFSGVTPTVVQNLANKGFIRIYEEEIYRNPYADIPIPDRQPDIQLSEEQNEVFKAIYKQYAQHAGGTALLYGVTGSGKTLVFMRLIDEVLRQKQNTIVMVPEISLTPQTVSLFHQRYGRSVAVFHSKLSLAQRLDEWKRVKNGEVHIVVGTRSAVFAPFEKIGLIIMDEEQEYTYKSESPPRYHARDVAKFRCAHQKALLLLCSATPSVESYYFAKTGKYSFHQLPNRYGEAQLPQVTVVDMNEELESGNTTTLSNTLLDALEENLYQKRQSIILLNRRGYHTFAQCKACGHVVTCPHCSISLTYHAANHRLMCHYCGYSIPFSQECPECHSYEVRFSGTGTQRAEEQLQDYLPKARVLRLDTDSTMNRDAYEKKLSLFKQGEYDIIVGTQMVAKGLDFENVTLVGVLNADLSLYSDDFRSYERTFDLLTQVVGRAGRGRWKGQAVIQTMTPENAIIGLAARQDYPAFFKEEIIFRKTMLYPPFADLAVIGFIGTNERLVQEASFVFMDLLCSLAKQEYSSLPMRVLSPSSAAVSKINNKFRYKLIIKCKNNKQFRKMLSELLVQFAKQRKYRSVTVVPDVNPDIIL